MHKYLYAQRCKALGSWWRINPISLCIANETMHRGTPETTAVPPLYFLPFWDVIKRKDVFAADQDGGDRAGFAEVRATVGQVLVSCPAGWPQPGWAHYLQAASARWQSMCEHVRLYGSIRMNWGLLRFHRFPCFLFFQLIIFCVALQLSWSSQLQLE